MLMAGDVPPLTTGNGAKSGFLPASWDTPDGALLTPKLAAAAVVGMLMLLASWLHNWFW